jgi:hypothetical protein
MDRFDRLFRVLDDERRESAGPASASPPPAQPVEKAPPDLSVPLPPLSANVGDQQLHLWLQQRISELGEESASLWQRMAGLLRAKGAGNQAEAVSSIPGDDANSGHRQPQLEEF